MNNNQKSNQKSNQKIVKYNDLKKEIFKKYKDNNNSSKAKNLNEYFINISLVPLATPKKLLTFVGEYIEKEFSNCDSICLQIDPKKGDKDIYISKKIKGNQDAKEKYFSCLKIFKDKIKTDFINSLENPESYIKKEMSITNIRKNEKYKNYEKWKASI